MTQRDQSDGQPRVSIILVNYNTTSLLLGCLRSIEDHFHASSYEIIVVDNGSDGFHRSHITNRHPSVKVVETGQNLGFGRANNVGAETANGIYLWLLNSDTLVPPKNKLQLVLDFLDRHPDYAAASPLLVDQSGAVQPIQRAYFPGVGRTLLENPARLIAKVMPVLRRHLRWIEYNFQPVTEGDAPVVVAASLFVRREAFHEVGGFSPEYFMFLEDSDLCRKFADRGYLVRFLPEARMVHLFGKSISNVYERKRLYCESEQTYFRKWSTAPAALAVRLVRAPSLQVRRWKELRGPGRPRPDPPVPPPWPVLSEPSTSHPKRWTLGRRQ